MKKAIFLDRDGVINVDKGYVFKREDFEFIDGVFEALRILQQLGYILVIVTNQSGIGRGYFSEKDLRILTNWMMDELEKRKIFVSGFYYCPHLPEDNCFCRKPNPGLILKASEELYIDLQSSWLIGDKKSDIEAAIKAGIRNYILISESEISADLKAMLKLRYRAKNLLEASRIINYIEISRRNE